MDLSSWLNLFDDYKHCISRNDSLFKWTVDDTPLKTYAQLLKLLEACIVAFHWANYSYPPPNAQLYLSFLNTTYECYRDANPIEMINIMFNEVSYSEFRKNILELYAGCSEHHQGLTTKPDHLRFYVRWMIKTGWLLLQTNYFPEDWLFPDSFVGLRCPMPEKEVKYWRSKNLSIKEVKKLAKTLSKLYYEVEVYDQIYSFEDRLNSYLDTNDSACLNGANLKTRDRLLKILDILTIILLDFCKRRTKSDGVRYPQLSNAKEMPNEQKAENL